MNTTKLLTDLRKLLEAADALPTAMEDSQKEYDGFYDILSNVTIVALRRAASACSTAVNELNSDIDRINDFAKESK